jgi:23S rRNA pseudouridine2457 synthase
LSGKFAVAYRYLLFYKPYNVLSQFSDDALVSGSDKGNRQAAPEGANTSDPLRQTLKDYISVPEVYPVGRLDRDSEGLMLLTNHGRLQHRLTDPRYAHPRTYWVQVERIPGAAALAQLRSGVIIKNYRTRPAQIKLLDEEPDLPPRQPPIRFRKAVPTAWLEVTITEGRNRQVRRMTAAVGHPTLRLVRVAIAHLRLDGLTLGQWRDLTAAEQSQLLRL